MVYFWIRRRKVCQRILWFGMTVAYLNYANPGFAEVIYPVPGDVRMTISRWIAGDRVRLPYKESNTTPLYIWAVAIQDSLMVKALREGAQKRPIRIVLEETSPEIESLAGLKNLQIRISRLTKHRLSGKHKFPVSFVMQIGQESMQRWNGPLVWRQNAYRSYPEFFIRAWDDSGWQKDYEVQEFDHVFALARPMKLLKWSSKRKEARS